MDNEDIKCPFCKSINTKFINSYPLLNKQYSKQVLQNAFENGSIIFNASKCLCLDCGMIFDFLDTNQLKVYKENEEYFK